MRGKAYSVAEKNCVTDLYTKGISLKDISKHCFEVFGNHRNEISLLRIIKMAGISIKNTPIIKDVPTESKVEIHHKTILPTPELTELSSFTPKLENFTDYLERKTLIEPSLSIMNLPLKDRKPIFFLGDTSTGKTSLPEYLAAKYKYPFLLISADSSLNFNDLLFKVKFENATATYEPGLFVKFFESESIIVIDELPSATPDIFFKFHELLQQKQVFVKEIGKVYKQHPRCFIFASGNFKNALYIGNNKLNEALVSRFHVKVVEDFTEEELAKILKTDEKMKTRLIQFYKDIKDLIKKQNKKFIISLRNLQSFTHLYNQGMNINDAFEWSILDSILVNNTIEDRKSVFNLAVTIIPGLGK
jgi:hypothetical protein